MPRVVALSGQSPIWTDVALAAEIEAPGTTIAEARIAAIHASIQLAIIVRRANA